MITLSDRTHSDRVISDQEVALIRSDILRGHLDSIILSLLTEEDRYGYDISKEITLRTEGNFEVKEGTLYAVFQRLEKKAYISSYYGEHSHGGKRKYYTITGNGKMYLQTSQAEWKELKQVVDLFMEE